MSFFSYLQNKKSAALVVVLALVVFFTSLLYFSRPQYHIVLIGTFTGKQTALGDDILRAVTIALSDFENISKSVHFDVVDLNVYAKEQLALELRRLDPDLIIGFDSSTSFLESEPFIQDLDYPIIGLAISTQQVTKKDDPLFRIVNDNHTNGLFASQKIANQFNTPELLIICDTDNVKYSLEMATNIKTAYPQPEKVTILTDSEFTSKTMDLRAYSLVYLILSPQKNGLMTQQIQRIDERIPIVSSGWGFSPVALDYQVSVKNSLYYIFLYDIESPKVTQFIKDYQLIHSKFPGTISFLTYEALSLVDKSINQLHFKKKNFGAELNLFKNGDSMSETSDVVTYSTGFDTIDIDRYGDCLRPIYLLQFDQNTYKTVNP